MATENPSATSSRAHAELRKDRSDPRESVIATVVNRVGADAVVVAAALDAAAPRPGDRRRVRDHLAGTPDALTSGTSDGPPVLARLIKQLHERGIDEVRLPECVQCRRAVTLHRRVSDGRLCIRCAARANSAPCSGCGKTKPVATRNADGGPVCGWCSRQRAACTGCDREAVIATRTEQGEPLCPACAPKRERSCSSCGQSAPAHALTTTGPVCQRCYTYPERECGICGEVRRVALRAQGDHPDTCVRCYSKPISVCPVCGQRTDCGHDHRPSDLLPGFQQDPGPAHRTDQPPQAALRRARTPTRPCRPCTFCGELKPVQVRWPAGDACNACYTRVLSQPGPCARCGREAVLVGEADGHPTCGPCAGSTIDYRCATCDRPGRMYKRRRCVDCVLEERLHDLLGSAGDRLEPLRIALMLEPDARAVLAWMRRPGVDTALRELAADQSPQSPQGSWVPTTHATIDALTSGKSAEYLRALLVDIGMLPPRNEPLERTATWLTACFEGADREHVRLVRPFAEWTLMSRARRKDRAGKFTVGSARFLRHRVFRALHFLTWLDDHGWSLAALRQQDVDLYLASGPTTRYQVRDFIIWAIGRREAPEVSIPLRRTLRLSNAYDEPDRMAHINRLLHDMTIPLAIRVAGALALIYGQHISRVVTWTVDRVGYDERSCAVTLRFDRTPVQLVEPLGGLVWQLVDERRGQARAERTGDWLFPGGHPGRHMDPGYLRVRLNAYGINLRDSRNAALAELATDIPAPVLAELLGMHDNTAVAWTKSMQRDWATFVAASAGER